MRIKGAIKHKLYNRRGYFNYFGEKIFFPKNSLIFKLACEQGIYDYKLLKYIKYFLKEGTTFFDIGTNIGLISVPVLAADNKSNIKVVSIEPTPFILECLQKTRENSNYKDAWTIIDRAVSDFNGEIDFFVDGEGDSAFNRVSTAADKSKVRVKCDTLDDIWIRLNSPAVSVIKIDIEGYDFFALKGGSRCIRKNRPVIFIEWYEEYISKFGLTHESLLTLCREYSYNILCINSLLKISSVNEMKLHQQFESNFILIPDD